MHRGRCFAGSRKTEEREFLSELVAALLAYRTSILVRCNLNLDWTFRETLPEKVALV